MEHVTVAPWNMSRSTMMVGSMVCPIYRLNNVKRPTRGGGVLGVDGGDGCVVMGMVL